MYNTKLYFEIYWTNTSHLENDLFSGVFQSKQVFWLHLLCLHHASDDFSNAFLCPIFKLYSSFAIFPKISHLRMVSFHIHKILQQVKGVSIVVSTFVNKHFFLYFFLSILFFSLPWLPFPIFSSFFLSLISLMTVEKILDVQEKQASTSNIPHWISSIVYINTCYIQCMWNSALRKTCSITQMD